ncbi:MAG: hypothetical protein JWM93_2926 [Frankiales bacterium]|nr:hypothetical protein [Frankiales bacterium]
MLYIVAPELSDVDAHRANLLLAGAEDELDDIPHSRMNAKQLLSCNPGDNDGVVFFNPFLAEHADDAEALLERAAEAGAVLLPIAMDSVHRRPPTAASKQQSFDVADHLRRRSLPDDRLRIIGHAFSREALSMTMPTYVQSRLRLFLCHRREDGEDLAALTDEALVSRHEHVFRDLIDVQAGENAQQKIDEALSGADVLVFLDTPRAHESWWVSHELATALGRGIPIVWIRLGPDDVRRDSSLPVKPDAAPHLTEDDVALSDEAAGRLADEIVRVATRLALRHLQTSKRALNDLKRWASASDASVHVLDARQQIFQVRYPPVDVRRYPLRAATDIVQFFGRGADADDRERLESYLTDNGMGPHDHECRAFDAAILLDPTSAGHSRVGEWSVTEHPTAFLQSLTTPAATPVQPRLLLLGAYPNGDFARDQMTSAVHATAMTWLALGGEIVCGGHPTFVPLLTEAARIALEGADTRDALVVYWSEWFAAPAQVLELEKHATVVVTAAGADRDSSLTTMREQMVGEGRATKVLAIGGRTAEGGAHVPGIDEEIRLARIAGLPVYVLGGPGGQAAVAADAAASATVPWDSFGNGLRADGNAYLRETEEYEEALRRVWEDG